MRPSPDTWESLFDGLPQRAIRSQLERILGSEIFSRSERLSAFLRFAVEETLAGRGDTLKEQVIAGEVYGKGPSSQDDPVVRVDARRLRDKLREFYAGSEREPIIITLPKGTYTPVFERNPSAQLPVITPLTSKPEPVQQPNGPPAKTYVLSIAGVALAITLASVAIWLTTRTPPQAPRVVSLTSYAGMEIDPSLSPDGNFVAFAWSGTEKRGPLDIWIKAVDSEALRRLTDTPRSESAPSWSPDGKELAFARGGEGVFIVSQLGGSERKIWNSGANPRWTPDGRSLLVRDIAKQGTPSGIFQIDLATLTRRQITRPSSGDGDWKFEVSPDGVTLAFTRFERTGMSDIYRVPLAGGEPARVTDLAATIFGLTWTPDGREIIFSLLGEPLRRIPAKASTPGKGTGIAGLGPIAAFRPTVSGPSGTHGTRLAFETQRLDISLRLVELPDANSDGILPSKPFLDATRIDIPGRFSPDGQKIAFQSGVTGHPWRLGVAARDGNDFRPIASSDVFMEIGKWSPDGRNILYSASIGGNSDIYVIEERGVQPRRLTTDPAIELSPSWSGNSKWVYYSSNRTGRHEIWKIPSEGGQPVQITHGGGAEPIESPDGKSVFYLDRIPFGFSAVQIRSTLKSVPIDGGPEEPILDGVRYGLWDITRQGILFLNVEREFDAIDLYRLPDGKVTRIGRLPFRIPRQNGFCRAAFSPDGRWVLASEVNREESDLMMIDDFR